MGEIELQAAPGRARNQGFSLSAGNDVNFVSWNPQVKSQQRPHGCMRGRVKPPVFVESELLCALPLVRRQKRGQRFILALVRSDHKPPDMNFVIVQLDYATWQKPQVVGRLTITHA